MKTLHDMPACIDPSYAQAMAQLVSQSLPPLWLISPDGGLTPLPKETPVDANQKLLDGLTAICAQAKEAVSLRKTLDAALSANEIALNEKHAARTALCEVRLTLSDALRAASWANKTCSELRAKVNDLMLQRDRQNRTIAELTTRLDRTNYNIYTPFYDR